MDRDQRPLPARMRGWLTGPVFIGDEVLLDIGFEPARARMARLARGELLLSSSEGAYEHGTIGLSGAGAAGLSGTGAGLSRVGAGGLSKLVRVQARELADADGCARWAIRWEAMGTGGALFPVFDADLGLVPVGRCTVLTLSGSYRPPFGALGAALDRAIMHRVAATTVRNFLDRVAAQITGEPGPAEAAITGTGPALPSPDGHCPG